MPASRLHGCLVALLAAVVLLPRLGAPALWDDDEPKNAACSLAMLEAGEWVVPTFNGRLRVEKPVLVNWLQMAGFAACGRNETGARLPSALATIATCLLTWRIGCLLFGAAEGLVGGLVMATCVWTAVGGRAATPDAALELLTTLALWLVARGVAAAGRPHGGPALTPPAAIALGGVLGAAALAKGPVGIVLPLAAFCLFAGAVPASDGTGRPAVRIGARIRAAGVTIRRLRPLTILAAACAVAGPWYALVAIRTAGEWPRGFLLVHNIERFARPLEGHSGSLLYYPGVLCVGLFPWSIVLAAMLAHAGGVLRSPEAPRRRSALLLACWAAVWLGAFTCAGTKLPGYIWPAYPALAIATGVYLVDWSRGRAAALPGFLARLAAGREAAATLAGERAAGGHAEEAVLRLAWCILAAAGVAVGVALPLVVGGAAPGGGWLWLPGCLPLAAAALAWWSHSAGRPRRAIAAVAVGGCLFTATLAGPVAEWFSGTQGPRRLVAELPAPPQSFRWACLWNVPPSLVFYTGSRIDPLDTPADVAAHLASHPLGRVVIDSRQEGVVVPLLPAGTAVLARVPAIAAHEWLLVGRTADDGPPGSPAASHTARGRQPPWPPRFPALRFPTFRRAAAHSAPRVDPISSACAARSLP